MSLSKFADDDGGTSSSLPYSFPNGSNRRPPAPAVVLNSVEEAEKWNESIVNMFVSEYLFSDLSGKKDLRCLPPAAHATIIEAQESKHWDHTINLKVSTQLKAVGITKPGLFVPRVLPASPPLELKMPDFSATHGDAKEKKALVQATTELFKQTQSHYEANLKEAAARHADANALALKQHETISADYEKERSTMFAELKAQELTDARTRVWFRIISTLGLSFNKINETVEFGKPAALVAAIETALYTDPEGEATALLLQLIQSTFANEGWGDIHQWHRYVLLTSRKIAALKNESVRDGDMRLHFIKGLPDDIFTIFKSNVHNNPLCKTFEDVFNNLKVFATSGEIKPKIAALAAKCARMHRSTVPAGVFVTDPRPPPRLCADFQKGKCSRGASCRWSHSPSLPGGAI